MPEPDTYHTIQDPTTGSVRDRGSKFLAFAFPVTTEDEIQQLLLQIKKQYHDAHHHCYAWALGPDRMPYRTNDDGEPSGSAGKPIFGQILSKNLTDVLIVVVRYFGGTKLGIPGLIQAYRGAVINALDNAVIVTKTITIAFEIRCPYPLVHDVMYIIKEENLTQADTRFDVDCRLVIHVRKNQVEKVYEKFKGIYGIEISPA